MVEYEEIYTQQSLLLCRDKDRYTNAGATVLEVVQCPEIDCKTGVGMYDSRI